MIELDVMDCCHNCGQFEAEVDHRIVRGDNGILDNYHLIKCIHNEFCRSQIVYLRNEVHHKN